MGVEQTETQLREPPNGGARAWMVTGGAFAAQVSVSTSKILVSIDDLQLY